MINIIEIRQVKLCPNYLHASYLLISIWDTKSMHYIIFIHEEKHFNKIITFEFKLIIIIQYLLKYQFSTKIIIFIFILIKNDKY